MKIKSISFAAAMLLAFLLNACGGWDDEADLVFISGTRTEIGSVSVDLISQTNVVQNADSCPLSLGESFGFSVKEWPAVVRVYGDTQGRNVLAELTVQEAPPEDGRWYVTAGDSPAGLALTLSSELPSAFS